MNEINLRNYAYLGDAVWELYIRNKTVLMTNNAKKLHQITTSLVKTQFQADLLKFLDNFLNDNEKELIKRARNLPIPVGRRSIQHEYRQATAFEALIGWLYLNENDRYNQILKLIEDSDLISYT